MCKKIGFLVNPIAGLGGKAGFKGSDNIKNQQRALKAGYRKTACERARQCMGKVKTSERCVFVAPEGEMGGDVLEGLGISYQKIGVPKKKTTREDTIHCLQLFQNEQVELIVFCGGDGTARDICEGNKMNIPVLGIPAGVKMYSGCFAMTPQIAGDILKDYIAGRKMSLELCEVMDLEEMFIGEYSAHAKLYGCMNVINSGPGLQGTKTASVSSPFETEILAKYMVSEMTKGTLYIIGPGSTTYQIKKEICGVGTYVGVDVVKDGRMIKRDADEKALIDLIEKNGKTEIIVTCIGGNGFVFGRGNQQISARIIKLVGKENIRLAITKDKLASLQNKPMYVDTGEREIDKYLSGYYKINFNKQEAAVYKMQSV